MDDWVFGIWVVHATLLTALCYLTAEHLVSCQSPVAKMVHHFLLACSWAGLVLVATLVGVHL